MKIDGHKRSGKENRKLKKSISNDEIDTLPRASFQGSIHMVESDEDVNYAVNYLKQQSLLGFDTETRPSFAKGKNNPVSLLQLATSDKAFLFRLNLTGLPSGLINILSSPDILKIGVAIRDDIRILQLIKPFKPTGFIELQDMVGDFGIENFSLKKLSAIVLGIRISKSQRLSNWDAPTLSDPQRIYAATDAWVCLEIYSRLKEISTASVSSECKEDETAGYGDH